MKLSDRLRLTFWRLLPLMSLALTLVLTACERASGGGGSGGSSGGAKY